MTSSLFHSGEELFGKFRVNVEAEITFTDFCKDLLFVHKHAIKFTSRAIMFLYPTYEHSDWQPAETIDFVPWDSVHSIENVRGSRVTKRTTAKTLQGWLSSMSDPDISFPYLHASPGHLALLIEGVPRSERSKGGKRRMKLVAEAMGPNIKAAYPVPTREAVQMAIDVFSANPSALPDVDRLCKSIMDAFEGLAYMSDKQVTDLRPRVINSRDAFRALKCETEPMGHFEVENIPAGSLYPLATGIQDYYVIRISS